MLSYDENRSWSDRFIESMRYITGFYSMMPAPPDVDRQEATDLVMLNHNHGLSVACRVRRPEYYEHYRYDFTIRSGLDSGSETEYSKICKGYADWMLYAHAVPDWELYEHPGFRAWMLINLKVFRYQMLFFRNQIKVTGKNNRDGTRFNVYDVRSFPHSDPPLLISSQNIFPDLCHP